MRALIFCLALVASSACSADENQLKPGDTFSDCESCPEMVVVPAGKFVMGAREHDKQARLSREMPRVLVTIQKPFAVGRYEVTFSQYSECFDEGFCSEHPKAYGWGGETQPIGGISWFAAKEYVQWLSRKTSAQYDLLSEAEWEYAARAGTTSTYWWGDELGILNAKCPQCDGTGRLSDSFKAPTPIGNFPPNPFGVFDVSGNLSEWTLDCFNEQHSKHPVNGEARKDGNCDLRMVRGGNFAGPGPYRARLSSRQAGPLDTRSIAIGFRVKKRIN